ncbi:hypothetical protein [Desulfobacter postgatei]|uniref:hypothetical protein n=1 Tax=Desulfobacter postgatei TaxID=2293 RepID=UPI00259B69F7|nr:hypothetical protein [uncultured Desulfobacter sp.]
MHDLYTIRAIGVSPGRMIMGFMVATAFLPMWVSNTATLLVPIMGSASIAMGIYPFATIAGACVAASYTFMLPVATPPPQYRGVWHRMYLHPADGEGGVESSLSNSIFDFCSCCLTVSRSRQVR